MKNRINWLKNPRKNPMRISMGVWAFKCNLELAKTPDNNTKITTNGSKGSELIFPIIKKKPIILPIETKCKLDLSFKLNSK